MILPGLVDPESGVIHYMPHIAVENWGLVGALRNAPTLPALLARYPQPGAGRALFWRKPDCEDSILVRACTGRYRGGIISNGRIFIGRNGNVGEIGHIQVDPLGERCHCGNFGCLETVAANAAIEQRVRHLLEQGLPEPSDAG